MSKFSRRNILRGMAGGGAVTLALPFLDCMLNTNGTALAGTAQRLPVRFGTWSWGCGMTPARWVPKKAGANYDLPDELKAIEPYRDQISVFSDYKQLTDGKPSIAHFTGNTMIRTGVAPQQINVYAKGAASLDMLIADAIGSTTRFRSLELASTGNARDSYSVTEGGVMNPAEVSPLALYTRIFGPEFQDPNAADFKPDPTVMLRTSVLSAVKDERDAFTRRVGSADRQRLDQYFTSLRQVEQQLELQLLKPAPADACVIPKSPADMAVGTEVEQVKKTHLLMARLAAMALACNQTQVVNMVFSPSGSTLRRAGNPATHHTLTHEEPVDPKLGYQPQATWFVERSMEGWAAFVGALAEVKEGDGTLLDNCMVLANSDTQFAKVHSIDGVPVMIAGKAGGRLRSGIHMAGAGEVITRIGFTCMQALGLPIDKWGTGSMETKKPITEILT